MNPQPPRTRLDGRSEAADRRARYLAELETWARAYTGPVDCHACGRHVHDCRCARPAVVDVTTALTDTVHALTETTAELARVRRENDALRAVTTRAVDYARAVQSGARQLLTIADAAFAARDQIVPTPRPSTEHPAGDPA